MRWSNKSVPSQIPISNPPIDQTGTPKKWPDLHDGKVDYHSSSSSSCFLKKKKLSHLNILCIWFSPQASSERHTAQAYGCWRYTMVRDFKQDWWCSRPRHCQCHGATALETVGLQMFHLMPTNPTVIGTHKQYCISTAIGTHTILYLHSDWHTYNTVSPQWFTHIQGQRLPKCLKKQPA